MNRLILVILAVSAIVIGASVLIPSGQSDGDPDIFAWPTCGEEGDIELTDYSGGVATFRAVPSEGWAVGTWTDSSGKVIGTELVLSIDAVSAGDVSLNFIQSFSRIITLDWSDHDGSTHRFTTTIDSDDFYASLRSDVMRNSTSTHPMPDLLLDDPIVDDIAGHIRGVDPTASGRDLADMIMHFVQDSIDYRSDASLYGCSEWWATPTETVFNGSGDCEDTTVLFVAIASMMGLDAGFVAMPQAGHMAAGVVLDDAGTFRAGSSDITYVETATDTGLEIGIIPVGYAAEGTWTPVSWSGAYTIGITVPIGSGTETSQSIWTGHITTEPLSTVGGNWNNGSRAGVGYANSNDSLSNANANNGARLTFIHHKITHHGDNGLTSWWNDIKNLSVPVGSASTIGDPTARDLNEGRWSL